MKWIMEIILG